MYNVNHQRSKDVRKINSLLQKAINNVQFQEHKESCLEFVVFQSLLRTIPPTETPFDSFFTFQHFLLNRFI